MVLYEVPLISANLSPQEMISQMVNTLEYLDRLSDDMFTRVSSRVRQSRDRINKIQGRVEAANAKINAIKSSKKATQIFSSSHFPASLKSETTGIFHGPKLEMKKTVSKAKVTNVKVDNDVVFYANHTETSARLPSLQAPKSVSELLVFNSEDLALWEQPASQRSSKAQLKRKHEIDVVGDNLLGEAPWSISQREHLDQSNLVNFSYTPGLGDVPELNLPLALPDLPGIADDLAYNEDIGPGIAPSLMAMLPDIVALTDNNVVNKPVPTPPPAPPVVLPEPPPESNKATPQQSIIRTSTPLPPVVLRDETANVVPAPPPPPPPPPPPDHLPKPTAPVSSPDAARPRPPPAVDMRANLMAAIRDAGGANKLKSSARVKHTRAVKEHKEQVAVDKGKAANPAGDLMADLFNKLSMRRKGISGLNAEGDSPPGKADGKDPMTRISQMIPPPPPPEGTSPSSDEVDDWK